MVNKGKASERATPAAGNAQQLLKTKTTTPANSQRTIPTGIIRTDLRAIEDYDRKKRLGPNAQIRRKFQPSREAKHQASKSAQLVAKEQIKESQEKVLQPKKKVLSKFKKFKEVEIDEKDLVEDLFGISEEKVEVEEPKPTPPPVEFIQLSPTPLTKDEPSGLASDPLKNPMGWVNEFYQNKNLLVKFNISEKYRFLYTVHRLADNITHSNKVTFMCIRDNLVYSFTATGAVKKALEQEVCYMFYQWLYENMYTYKVGQPLVDSQMDSTQSTEQGVENLEGEKRVNTILTRDVPKATDPAIPVSGVRSDLLLTLSSGEPVQEFESLNNRWFKIRDFTINTGQGPETGIVYLQLPQDVYRVNNVANRLVFNQFVFNKTNMEVRVKINGHKFCQGRAVCGYFYQMYTLGNRVNNNVINSPLRFRQIIQRHHAYLDYNESNEVSMVIPFQHVNTMTTSLVDTDIDHAGANYCTFAIKALTPLRVPDESPQEIPGTVFVRFFNTSFTGMRHFKTVDSQMGNAESAMDTCKEVMSTMKSIPVIGGISKIAGNVMGHGALALMRPFVSTELTKKIEKNFKYCGVVSNRDKPAIFDQPAEFRPNYVGNMAVGVEAEPVNIFRLDPTATTVQLEELMPEGEVKSLLELTRIWGFYGTFEFTTSQTSNSRIWADPVDPVPYGRLLVQTGRPMQVSGEFTPLETISNMFMYYSGSIEYRFDFICTQFHTGMVMVAFIPYNPAVTEQQARSAYYKIFDLREQKSFTFTVPYINNTILRMMPTANIQAGVGIQVPSAGTLCVYVQNPLTPIQSVPTTVDVVVYKRAGPDFRLTGNKTFTGRGHPIHPANLVYGLPIGPRDTLSSDDDQGYVDGQMSPVDTGDSENIDDTPTFGNVPSVAAYMQSLEDQTIIKDLMRRWTFLEVVNIAADAYYQRMVTLPNVSNPFLRSSQAIISTFFRWYRGSIRYMIEFEPNNSTGTFNNTSIDVMHIPVSGQAYTGVIHYDMDAAVTGVRSYAGTVVRPEINPSIKLEVPFLTPFNYLDIQVGRLGNPTASLDVVAGNLGTIFIRPRQNVRARFYFSMGDDAMLYHFMGCGQTTMYLHIDPEDVRPVEENIDTQTKERKTHIVDSQMMEAEEEEPEEFYDIDLTDDSDPMSQYTVPDNTPFPKPKGFYGATKQRIQDSMSSLKESLSSPFSGITQRVKKLDALADKADSVLDNVQRIAGEIVNSIKSKFSWITNTTMIFSSIVHFLQACIAKTWYGVALGIVGILLNLGFIAVEMCDTFLEFFSNMFRSSPDPRTEEHSVDSQCEHRCTQRSCAVKCSPNCNTCTDHFTASDISTLVGLACGAVSGILGFKAGVPKGLTQGLFCMTRNFWSTISVASRFLSNLMDLFFRLFRHYCSKKETTQLDYFIRNNAEDVEEFVKEAHLMLDERNLPAFENDPMYKHRFWLCVVNAYALQKRYTLNPVPEAGSLLRLCKQVIDLSNKIAVQATSCPVRFEPYVITLSGEAKVGKSTLAQHVIPEILSDEKGLNLRTYSSPIYVRVPGVEYWNNFKNQPAILFDDFLASMDPNIATAQVADLYMLKSTALMNVNMADLNDKKMLCNSFLVWLNRNNPFQVPNGIACSKAFLRRQEHVWHVELKPEYNSISDVPEDILEKWGHLVFYKYRDPTDKDSLNRDRTYTYDEWLNDVKSDFAKYLVKERKMVALRVNRLKLTLPSTASDLLEDADPFRIFYKSYMEAVDDPELSQTGFLPSEAIERQLELVSETVDQIRQARERFVASASQPQPRTEQDNQYSYYYSQPSTSQDVDGQIPIPEFVNSSGHYVRNVYRMLRERTKQALHWLMYRPPKRGLINAPHYLRDSRPYGTCPVCLEDNVEIWTSCPNDPNHGTCRNCWQGMLNRSDMAVACPVCRCARFVEIQIDEDASEQLRAIIMWKHLKSGTKAALRKSTQFFRSRWFPLLVCNAGLIISMASQLNDLSTWYNKQLEIVHNTYEFVSDGMFSGESVDYIGDKGREMKHYVRYDPIRIQHNNDRGIQNMTRIADNFIPGVHANKYSWVRRYDDDDEVKSSFKNYVGKFGQSTNVEKIWNDNFGDEVTWTQLDAQIGPNFYVVDDDDDPAYQTPDQIPDYKLTIPREKPKIVPIIEGYCKHTEMFKDPANVYYERQPSGVYMWVYTRRCIAEYELHDKPCQHKDCCFAKWSSRSAMLNLWYKHHHTEIVQALRSFNYDPTSWHYPREFLPEACQEAVYDTRQAIMEQLAGMPHRQSWFDWICEKGDKAWQKFGKVIKVGLAFLAALGVALAGYNLVKFCLIGNSEGESEQIAGQIHNSGAFQNRTLARTNKQIRRRFATGQMDQIEEVTMRHIMRNSVIMRVTYKENGRPMVVKTRGFGVYGRTMLLNKHIALTYLKFKHRSDIGEIEDFKLTLAQFTNPELEVEVKVEKETFLFGSNEIAVMRVPNYFPQFKDVTNFIMTADQHNQIGSEYTHVEVDRDGRQVVRTIPGKIVERVDTVTLKACEMHPEVDGYDMYMTNYGAAGACGSIYIAPGQAPIFAMHSAGINSRKKRDIGYGCPIIREDIEDLKAGEAVLDYFVPRSSTADAQMSVSGKCVVLAKVGKDLTPYMPTKTKIEPSLLQGKIEGVPTLTQPGILTSRDPRWKFEMTPLYWGIQKHLDPPKGFPEEAVMAAYEDLRSVIIHNVTPLRPEPGVLDLSTACVGKAIDYYDPMKLETSAGWPWCATSEKTKAELVKYTRDAQQRPIKAEIDQGVLNVLMRKREMRSRGIRPLTVFVDWLKDERRKQSKLEKPGGTRVFCASPIDFTIECRAFFLDFMAAYMKARMDAEHCVGISTDGPEWTELVRRLSVIKGPFADGDFSDFGPRASSQVAKFAFDIILDWYSVYGNYSDEEMQQARVMVEELINADHIATNVIYRTVCGLPSGSALTVIQNTLQLCLYFRIAWYEMMVKGYNYKMSDYHRLVKIFGYGDDCIMKIDESIAERFNIQTLSSFFEMYTLKFTDASKLGTSKTTPFSEVSFLKCGFKEHPYRKGEYLAPIDEISIHECAQWIWKSRDDKAATLENAEQSLRLAYGHGPEYFRDWKRKLDTALIAEGMPPLRLTWEEIDRGFFGELIIGDFERAVGPIDELLGLRWCKPQKRTDEPANQKKKSDISGVFEIEQDIDYIPTEHVQIKRLTHEKIEEEAKKIEENGLSYTGEELEWISWL